MQEEVAQDIANHLSLREEEFRAKGMGVQAAQRAARERFGDVERIASECEKIGVDRDRRERRRNWYAEFRQDLQYAARHLANSKQFTFVVIATLALGLGASTSIFAIANVVLLRPLPFAQPDELVSLYERTPAGADYKVSASNFLDWAAEVNAFSSLAAYSTRSASFVRAGPAERLLVASVSHTLTRTLGTRPVVGRSFGSDDDRVGGDTKVAMLSYGLWQREFGGDASAIGSSVDLDGIGHRVVGVMGADFNFPAGAALWIPLVADPEFPRDDRRLEVVGRLRLGATLERGSSELRRLAEDLSLKHSGNAGWSANVRPFRERFVSAHLAARVKLLLVAVVGLLIIACANVANLILVRAVGRDREMAIRSALGAGRGRVIRQLLAESVTLSVGSTLVGIAMSSAALPMIRAVGSAAVPQLNELAIDWSVLAFASLMCLLTTIVFGLVPASRLSLLRRASSVDRFHTLLRSGSRVMESGRVREVLLMGSMALATVLLVCAVLVSTSFRRLMSQDPGFETADVIAAELAAPVGQYTPERTIEVIQEAETRIRNIPGVLAVGATSIMPFSGINSSMGIISEERVSEGRDEFRIASWRTVTPGYFESLKIPVQVGRVFGAADRLRADEDPATDRRVVVNEVLADQWWPAEDAIGKRLALESGNSVTVIGVVGGTRHASPDSLPEPTMYFAHAEFPTRVMALTVRVGADSPSMVSLIRSELARLDPHLPVGRIHALSAALAAVSAEPGLTALVFAIFATASLTLVTVGLYGLVSWTVSQRTSEIGLKMALGASPQRVLFGVLSRGLAVASLGVLLGLTLSAAAARLIGNLLYETSGSDPVVYLTVVVALVVITMTATGIPALRAARLDPFNAIRSGS